MTVVGCGGRQHVVPSRRPYPELSVHLRLPLLDLPERMSRPQVEACQRFGPLWAWETVSPVLQGSEPVHRDLYPAHAERPSRRVWQGPRRRLPACRARCKVREPPRMRCVGATHSRRHPRGSHVSTALVSEPAAFDGIWLVSNTRDEWFPDPSLQDRVSRDEERGLGLAPRPGGSVPLRPRRDIAQPGTGPRPTHGRSGGGRRSQIDFFVSRGDANARHSDMCGEEFIRDVPCPPITADPNDEGYVGWYLDPGTIYRFIDVSMPSRRVIIHRSSTTRANYRRPTASRER